MKTLYVVYLRKHHDIMSFQTVQFKKIVASLAYGVKDFPLR